MNDWGEITSRVAHWLTKHDFKDGQVRLVLECKDAGVLGHAEAAFQNEMTPALRYFVRGSYAFEVQAGIQMNGVELEFRLPTNNRRVAQLENALKDVASRSYSALSKTGD